MRPIKVSENVYWVGAIDWSIRDFHGYATPEGTTYNAYLILDEKITLIDTVKAPMFDHMLAAITALIDPKDIDIVISNHCEMDHSGGLTKIMDIIGREKPVYCSKMGEKSIMGHFHGNLNLVPVDNDTQLNIGQRTLNFIEARMLHWPDSMFTYSGSDKILFSSDAFGQHYAGLDIFDDLVRVPIMPHALKYFANILMPFSNILTKALDALGKMNLEIDIIAPDHGVIWRENPGKILQAYADWAQQKPTKKAVIVYDSMWDSTAKMAETITYGLMDQGVEAKSMRLRATHRSDIITEIMEAGAILVGSPTLNNGMFPTVADFLAYMKGLRPKNKIAASFGSYGWSGEAIKLINQELQSMKLDVMEPGLKIQWVPDLSELDQCFELGVQVGKALSHL